MKNGEDAGRLVSVLVVVSERAEPLDAVYTAHADVLRQSGIDFEFIFAVEPWHAGLLDQLSELRAKGEPIRTLELAQGAGETTLLRVAASRASGEVLLTLPAYWRVEPDVLPELVRAVADGADLAMARRWPRSDSWINRVQNRVFHRLVRYGSGSRFEDLACGVRAFRPEILDEVPLYGDFHRFFPLLVDRAGFRVEQISAPQHPEDRQPRVYAPGTYLRRALDILGMFFLLRFTHKPLRFFGLLGSGLSVAGGLVLLVLLVQRIGGQGLADRPMLLLGVLLLALGIQAIALGLIGEIMVFLHAPDRPPYRIAREVRETEPAWSDQTESATGGVIPQPPK